MASSSTRRTIDVPAQFSSRVAWLHGGLAGFLAASVMTIAIGLGSLELLRDAIAGLYLLEGNLLAGVVVHVVHGTLFGVVFAVVLSDPGLYGLSRWYWKVVLAGLIYGLVLAVVGAGIIMPIWLAVIGGTIARPIPNVTVPLLTWHAIYGVVLGGAFGLLERRDGQVLE